MHVLMMYMKNDGRMLPGHDDLCEVHDVAMAISELGASVTVVGAGMRAGSESQMWNMKPNGQRIRFLPAPPLGVIPLARAFRMPLVAVLQANLSALKVISDRWRRGDRFDVIHCFGWQAGLAAGLLGEMMELPVVVTARDVAASRSSWWQDPSGAYSRCVCSWLFPRCGAILCADEQLRSEMQDLFLLSEGDLIVLPPLMSSVNTRASRRSRKMDEKNILVAGLCDPTPGWTSLFRACARMTDGRKTQLRILLCRPETRGRSPALGAPIRRSGLAEQIFILRSQACPGWWTEILSVTDLLFLPDPVAFVGNVVLRAVIMGVPVLAVQCASMRMLFPDTCAEVTYPQDREEMLLPLLEAILFDERVRMRLVAEELRIARGWQPVAPRLMSLYQQIYGHGRTGNQKGGEIDDIRSPQPGGDGGLRE